MTTERRLIVSMACTNSPVGYSEVTFPLMQAYARKCNADFYALLHEDTGYGHIGYQKWEYLKMLYIYDRILHIDADIIVRADTPNLFDLVPFPHFGAVDELPFQNSLHEFPFVSREKDMYDFMYKYNYIPVTPRFHINLGIYLFSRAHRHVFGMVRQDNPCYFKEQTHINANLHDLKTPITFLSHRFNFMKLMETSGLRPEDAHMIHYAGSWGGLTEEQVLDKMKLERDKR